MEFCCHMQHEVSELQIRPDGAFQNTCVCTLYTFKDNFPDISMSFSQAVHSFIQITSILRIWKTRIFLDSIFVFFNSILCIFAELFDLFIMHQEQNWYLHWQKYCGHLCNSIMGFGYNQRGTVIYHPFLTLSVRRLGGRGQAGHQSCCAGCAKSTHHALCDLTLPGRCLCSIWPTLSHRQTEISKESV